MGTFLEDAPIVPVSAVTGQGLPQFIDTPGHAERSRPRTVVERPVPASR